MNTPSMTCIINAAITQYLSKGKRLEVIARYLKMKYKISIDPNVLRKRVAAGEMMPAGLS